MAQCARASVTGFSQQAFGQPAKHIDQIPGILIQPRGRLAGERVARDVRGPAMRAFRPAQKCNWRAGFRVGLGVAYKVSQGDVCAAVFAMLVVTGACLPGFVVGQGDVEGRNVRVGAAVGGIILIEALDFKAFFVLR